MLEWTGQSQARGETISSFETETYELKSMHDDVVAPY